MNRKISLGVTIALMSLAAAVAIVITAGYSMYDFNGRMQSLRESEVMYDLPSNEKVPEIPRHSKLKRQSSHNRYQMSVITCPRSIPNS